MVPLAHASRHIAVAAPRLCLADGSAAVALEVLSADGELHQRIKRNHVRPSSCSPAVPTSLCPVAASLAALCPLLHAWKPEG